MVPEGGPPGDWQVWGWRRDTSHVQSQMRQLWHLWLVGVVNIEALLFIFTQLKTISSHSFLSQEKENVRLTRRGHWFYLTIPLVSSSYHRARRSGRIFSLLLSSLLKVFNVPSCVTDEWSSSPLLATGSRQVCQLTNIPTVWKYFCLQILIQQVKWILRITGLQVYGFSSWEHILKS